MLIFVVSAVVYIDRSNISIAGTYLAADYHISKIQLGWVFSRLPAGLCRFPDSRRLGGGQAGPAQDPDLWPDLVERAFRRHRAGAAQHGRVRCGC